MIPKDGLQQKIPLGTQQVIVILYRFFRNNTRLFWCNVVNTVILKLLFKWNSDIFKNGETVKQQVLLELESQMLLAEICSIGSSQFFKIDTVNLIFLCL